MRICHPNADSYRDMDPNQIYRQHETEKKRQYASRILEVEQAIFTPLVLARQVKWGPIVSDIIKEGRKLCDYYVMDQG